MKEHFDFPRTECTTDSVVDLGHSIYDKWKEQGASSRKIVSQAERAAGLAGGGKAVADTVNALAHILALELRIEEKYNSILKHILFYFAHRREERALLLLKKSLRVVNPELDARTLIEIELQRLRDQIDGELSEADDDETRGGKTNGRNDSEGESAEETATEQQSLEDTTENEIAETEEAPENTEETPELAEEQPTEPTEQTEVTEDQPTDETVVEESEIPTKEAKEEAPVNKENEAKVESISPDEVSEPAKSEKKVSKTYNDAVDVYPEDPLASSEQKQSEKPERTSLLDEVITDNIVKGTKDIVNGNPYENSSRKAEAEQPVAAEETKDTVKNDPENDLGQKDMQVSEKGDEKASQPTQPKEENAKTESTKTSVTENKAAENQTSVKNELETVREPLSVNMNIDFENQMRLAVNDEMSMEAKMEFIRLQADAFREHMSITMEELGYDDPVEVIMNLDDQKPQLGKGNVNVK